MTAKENPKQRYQKDFSLTASDAEEVHKPSNMTVKYIKKSNGVHAYNPAWRPEEDAEIQLPPASNQSTALPVIATPLKANGLFASDDEIVVEPSYEQATIVYAEQMNEGIDELNRIFAKYEVPGGMLSKLLLLKNFDVAEMLVDDSGSMNAPTDAKGPHGEQISRWKEAMYNLFRMMEVLGHVNAPVIYVRFLNRSSVLTFQPQNETPQEYIDRTKREIEQVFASSPSGTTPAREQIQASLSRYPNQKVLRYFFGDGVPNGGPPACRTIEQLLIRRSSPADNPFTFISCTNQDEQTEWMKECEEVAPYCAEFDDFSDESREILKDQGKAFPYSFGLHLVGQLVAAFCPHDLDAMDESVPFTKQTLDSLMGYQSSPQDYRYYYDCFLEAQRQLYRYAGYQQAMEKKFALNQLPTLYDKFVTTSVANDIPEVRDYKQALKDRKNRLAYGQGSSPYSAGANTRAGYQPAQRAECCVLL